MLAEAHVVGVRGDEHAVDAPGQGTAQVVYEVVGRVERAVHIEARTAGEEVNHVKEMGEDEAPLVKSCCEMLAKLYFFVSFANKSLLFRTKVACKLVLGWRVAKELSEKIRAPWPGYRLKQKG